MQNGFATSPTTLTNTYAIDPNFRIAYAQTWNVSIQHTLPHGLVVDTEYIGTKGTHLGIVENPNRSISSIAQRRACRSTMPPASAIRRRAPIRTTMRRRCA